MRPGTQFEPPRAGAATEQHRLARPRASEALTGDFGGKWRVPGALARPAQTVQTLRSCGAPPHAHRGRRRGKVQDTFDPDREDRAVADRQT